MITWLASGELANSATYHFGSRLGGVSKSPFDQLNVANWVGDEPVDVAMNLNLLADQIGVAIKCMQPEHGTTVQNVLGDEDALKRADILVTTKSNVGLLAPSADCVSLFAATGRMKFLLAAHIGWRGAAAGIASKILSTAELYGVTAAELEVVLGPAICGWCYPVSTEVHDAVTDQLPAASTRSSSFIGVDLRVGLTEFFRSAGAKVDDRQPCTYESAELFSYRRDGTTGRQAAVAWLK